MSTRSWICLEQDDGYQCVYCHHDGYLEYNGAILFKHYQDYQKVVQLINLGGMSLLGENIEPDPHKPHTFDKPQQSVCIFYHRDRQESWESNKPFFIKDMAEFQQESLCIAYIYIYANGGWYYSDDNGEHIHQLTEAAGSIKGVM